MAVSGHRKGIFSVKRKLAIAVGIMLSGAIVGGMALVTAKPDLGSRYSLDDFRQQVLSMRPSAFEIIKVEVPEIDKFRTSLKKRYSYAPSTLPSGNRLVGTLAIPPLAPNIIPAPTPNDQLYSTPVSGPGFNADNLSVQTNLSGDLSVKGRFETIGNATIVPLTNIASVLGGGSPGNKIEGIVDDILGGGIVPPGESLKRSADTAFLLSGAGDGFPDSENVEIARNSVPHEETVPEAGSKTTAANGVPAPAPLLLLGAGLAGLGFLRRFMRSASP